ncbi:PilD-dependent protein PddA [Anaerohalosphaera lusitana]|uniref:PilD-dependent protein PddA n=1 Tax=Anaerohalosphaera lusitana TaxID=1936003 RepID=A0A1U9NN09_9BACT|nr:type II secretion system protein [Anaerohalosphaera lusitana]AQT68896.1 PilD-dependent protein PddA [Anaerohalosphaera lusitana]
MYNKKSGFTLVEILIVVVILGILAGIVLPGLGQASEDAHETNLKSNLQTVRMQIQLYKTQHDDLLPGQSTIGGNITQADFKAAILSTDAQGYGPYMHDMPKNMLLNDAAKQDDITIVNSDGAVPTGAEGTGWWLNAANGDFRACDSADHINW